MRLQQDKARLEINPIDKLRSELDLGSVEQHPNNISTPEKLGRWFSGVTSWAARS